MRIAVDPEALIAAGRQTGALGSLLGTLSGVLGPSLAGGIASGIDPAGMNFGMKYGRESTYFAAAVADAANAFTGVGQLLQATGFNYRNADAAATIGGPGPAGGVSGDAARFMPVPVPPGPNGITIPAPAMWYLVQPLLQFIPGAGLFAGTAMTWPSGNASMMYLTAAHWRNFATALAMVEPQLTDIKAAVTDQLIPERAAIMTALDGIGNATALLAEAASTVAQLVSDFSRIVDDAQSAIRRLLDRLSFEGLWDTVTGWLTGDGEDILREVARDVNTVIDNCQRQVQGIVGLLDELNVLIGDAATALQKSIRPALVEQFGTGAGNALANEFTFYTDVQVGAVTGLLGSLSDTVAMADPDTWTGMAALTLSVARDPSRLPGVVVAELKDFSAWDTWFGDHPGRAAGEVAVNVGSLFVPGGALSKAGGVARSVNLSRRVLDEGRLPRIGELGSWARGGAGQTHTPGVSEFTPAPPVAPPVRPERIPPTNPGAPTGAGGPSGPGPARTGEPPTPTVRPPAAGAEGGSGPRAPAEQPGRGEAGASAPSSEPAASPGNGPDSTSVERSRISPAESSSTDRAAAAGPPP